MQKNNLVDSEWAKVSSVYGSITVPVMEMAALNENTVWTWNAVGKRKGAWALNKQAPEATKGFLLNHLIHELLPPKAMVYDGSIQTRSRGKPHGSICM